MRKVLVLLFTLLVAAPAHAGEIDRRAREVVAAGAPGALALGSDGRRVAAGRARPGYRFRTGSVTKTFVSTIVLQLADEGRLSLDDPVARHLPGLVPGGETITLRQLLSHTSGLAEYGSQPEILDSLGDPSFTWSGRALAELAVKLSPAGPGFHYANTNYVLLGLTVEAVTGRRLPVVLRHRILRPLKLRATSFDTSPGIEGPHLHGHVVVDGKPEDTEAVSPSYAWAAGDIVSTARDLATFYGALLRGRLTSRAALREMRTPVTGVYGLGLFRVKTRCGVAYGHDGELLGTTTLALASRNGRRAAVAAAGVQGADLVGLAQAAYCR